MTKAGKKQEKWGFTLPEVVISFSVLVLVITSATGILSVVMRTNSDNVENMVAYGLAQEGLESFRFIRDSNFLLGLDFDGTKKLQQPWGVKLFNGPGVKYFKLLKSNPENSVVCGTTNLSSCLPMQLEELMGGWETLSQDSSTLVYKKVTGYDQAGDESEVTSFHRLIRVEALSAGGVTPEILRVSSMVFWQASNGRPAKLVLTSELTDWK